MGRSKLLKISSACAGLMGLLMLSSADVSHSAILAGYCEDRKEYINLLDSGGQFYYRAAYEYYDPNIGATTLIAKIRITPEADLNVNDYINLQLIRAKFNPPVMREISQDRLRFVLIDKDNNLVALASQPVLNPVNNIGFRVIRNHTAPGHLFLAVALVDESGGGISYDVKYLGTSIHIDPGLNVSCDRSADVLLGYTAPRDTGSGVIIRVTPRFKGLVPNLVLDLTQELSADDDFKLFVTDPVAGRTGNQITKKLLDPAKFSESQVAGCSNNWIVGDFSVGSLTGTLSFTLSSTEKQEGVQSMSITGGQGSCSADPSKESWNCTVTGQIFGGNFNLRVNLAGTISNSPALWSLRNVKFNIHGAGNLCLGQVSDRPAGFWYGGLEAIVPFVKKSPTGDYNTFIKFINRYNKTAKVYAQPFKNDSRDFIVPRTFVGEIPANGGVLTLDADRLARQFGLTSKEIDDGMPFKFLITVPVRRAVIDDGTTPAEHRSIGDPFVEGIVVSTSPGGQRVIPLKFRFWRLGGYNQ